MPDVSERIRAEPTRTRSKTAPAPSRVRTVLRALKPTSKRSLAGAALGAMMIGIVVNAVALQHGRRVAPALDPAPIAAVRPAPAAAPVAPPVVAARPDAQARPEPPHPSPSPVVVALAHAPKSTDAIADFLRGQGPDKRRLTLSAQGSLAKLGFGVKPTGALDADNRYALEEFEKSHHLPVSTEITPKLVKTLTTAAAAE